MTLMEVQPNRGFEIQLYSIVDIAGVVCTMVADIQKDLSDSGSSDSIYFTFQWDPVSKPLTIKNIGELFADLIVGLGF